MTVAEAYNNIRNRTSPHVEDFRYYYKNELITMIWHNRPNYIIVTTDGSYVVPASTRIRG